MIILRAFKTELDLNNRQKTACARHAGAARYTYNWGLARKIASYRSGAKVPTAIDLHRELNALKKTELAWMYEVSKCAPQEALRDLDRAYAHFFRRVKEKKAGKRVKVGFPRFKSKKVGAGRFRLTGAIHVFEKVIQLPRLGVLRLKESGYLPTEGVQVLSVTVSERAGRWFVSVQVEIDLPEPNTEGKPAAGIDLGLNWLATVSDGTAFENPRPLRSSLDKIKRLQRMVSRRQPGSANRRKALERLARAHQRVANIRKDSLHQATSRLAKTKSAVVLEDLNVRGMLRNHRLARAIADVGWYEFRRQMSYKGAWYGCQIFLADPYFPSTKRCSCCGHLKADITLSQRQYVCEACGLSIDRDLNAAINLEQLLTATDGIEWMNGSTASSAGSHACGEDVRPGYQATLEEAGTEPGSASCRFV